MPQAEDRVATPQADFTHRAIIPRATYRLQLNASFTLRDATALVPYLCDLGVSHVYCSPYLRARPGSTHGYDIVDHNSLNPEIADRDDLERFVAALRSHRMGHILDFVPNHVGIMGAENAWWMDVLENGQASIYAEFFDIDWQPVNPALAEIVACFPVYRTYIVSSVSDEDRRYIDWALAAARRRGAAIDAAVYDFVRGILLGEGPGAEPSSAAAARAFTMKLQQLTAPVTAKGIEDTAFYRFNGLVSINEVGGDPDAFGTSVRAFHADAQYRARNWPHELLATSTHDTKRSEDVRARIDVLSEMSGEWRGALERWSRLSRARRREVDGLPAPSRNDEYLLYETLLGTLPLEAGAGTLPGDYCARIEAYMVKAAREAKTRSSWSSVNAAYETALQEFIRGIVDPRPGNLFFADLVATVQRIARFGLLAALSQTLCKLTAPGVPDIYQGTELWDFSLVDPDNRRPVDYGLRQRLLAELRSWDASPAGELAARARALLDGLSDGRAKLYVISRTLAWRQAHGELFSHGDHRGLRVAGPCAAHLCVFARRHGPELAIAVAPRLYRKLLHAGGDWPLGRRAWGDTRIELPADFPAGMLLNLFDGTRLPVRHRDGRPVLPVEAVLESFPVALLAATPSEQEPAP